MKLEPLYRATFSYPHGWGVDLGSEEQHFYLAEGRCEGRVAGTLRGANHPRLGRTQPSCRTSRA